MITETTLAFCRENRLLESGDTVTVALSGGADSMALLHVLLELRQTLGITVRAAHFNHCLRGEQSQCDEDFVRAQCAQRSVPLRVGHGDVRGFAAQNHLSIEHAARKLRYHFFSGLDGKIATAHTADDNAETLLLHLLRGTGLRGLGGIVPQRGNIIRPFLNVTRAQIETYLFERDIDHVEDATNADDACLRNRLRHHVMPLLLEENPSFLQTVARTTLLLRQDEALLTRFALQAQHDCAADGGLSCQKLRALDAALRERVLLGQLWTLGLDNPSAVYVHALDTLVFSDDPSTCTVLPQGFLAERRYDRLVFCEQTAPVAFPVTAIAPDGCTELPQLGLRITCSVIDFSKNSQKFLNTFLLRYDMIAETPLYIRPRLPADRLRLSGGSKRVSRLMIDRKIPAAERGRMPVLVCGDRIAAVFGIGVDLAFRPQPGEQALAVRIARTGENDAP